MQNNPCSRRPVSPPSPSSRQPTWPCRVLSRSSSQRKPVDLRRRSNFRASSFAELDMPEGRRKDKAVTMHMRDASGRQVSLLNDDAAASPSSHLAQQRPYYRVECWPAPQPFTLSYPRSACSSPNTPELVRSDSYDSHGSAELPSPLTPAPYDYVSHPYAAAVPSASPYENYMDSVQTAAGAAGYLKQPELSVDGRATSYDSDEIMTDSVTPDLPAAGGSSATSPGAERPGKRYPCRYRDSHGCEKTFTTSGHASRHSKIHTAEKAVQCTHEGCGKKFTRADNMKQHLETHYKEKSASSTSSSRHSRHSSSSTLSSRPSLVDRRTSSPASKLLSTSSSRSKAAAARSASALGSSSLIPAAVVVAPPPPPPSQQQEQQQRATGMAIQSGNRGGWNMRDMDLPPLGRPGAMARTPSSGLEALALAIACQEGT